MPSLTYAASPPGRNGPRDGGISPAVVDAARGLAMVIVLYGHALEVFFDDRPDRRFVEAAFIQYKAMAAFAMPLFFMVSGAAAAAMPRKGWRSVVRTSLYLVALAYLVHFLGLGVRLVETWLVGDGDVVRDLALGFEAAAKGRGFSTIVVWFLVSLAAARLIVYALFVRMRPRHAHLAIVALGGASLLVPYLPNPFMLKTWIAGTVFFALGMALAPHLASLTRPAAIPLVALAPLAGWLALANGGCPYNPYSSCPLQGLGDEAVVWLHMGEVGFIPLFWLAALMGSVGMFALAGLLVRARLAAIPIHIGRRTMGLLIINGFVLVFVQPWFKLLPEIEPGPTTFAVLLVGVVVLHLAALRLLAHPLARLNRVAGALADVGVRFLDRWCGSSALASTRETEVRRAAPLAKQPAPSESG